MRVNVHLAAFLKFYKICGLLQFFSLWIPTSLLLSGWLFQDFPFGIPASAPLQAQNASKISVHILLQNYKISEFGEMLAEKGRSVCCRAPPTLSPSRFFRIINSVCLTAIRGDNRFGVGEPVGQAAFEATKDIPGEQHVV